MTKPVLKKTVLEVTILSALDADVENWSLERIAYETTEGSCSAKERIVEVKELSKKEAQAECDDQNTDFAFFGLGND